MHSRLRAAMDFQVRTRSNFSNVIAAREMEIKSEATIREFLGRRGVKPKKASEANLRRMARWAYANAPPQTQLLRESTKPRDYGINLRLYASLHLTGVSFARMQTFLPVCHVLCVHTVCCVCIMCATGESHTAFHLHTPVFLLPLARPGLAWADVCA